MISLLFSEQLKLPFIAPVSSGLKVSIPLYMSHGAVPLIYPVVWSRSDVLSINFYSLECYICLNVLFCLQ